MQSGCAVADAHATFALRKTDSKGWPMEEVARFDLKALEQLLPVIEGFVKQKQEGEPIDLLDAANQVAGALGIENVEQFAADKLHGAMEDGLGIAFDGEDAAALAKAFSAMCVPVGKQILAYAQGDATAEALLDGLESIRVANIGEIQGVLQNMLGVPDKAAEALSENLGPAAVSVYCFYATYKIYKSAARDAALARERRIQIEHLCSQAMVRLKEERTQMEEMVNSYLLARLLPFGEGVVAMDHAIMENDTDGFIKANAELWNVFGRNSQYGSAKEFDDLMLSDEAFRL